MTFFLSLLIVLARVNFSTEFIMGFDIHIYHFFQLMKLPLIPRCLRDFFFFFNIDVELYHMPFLGLVRNHVIFLL